MLFATQDGGKGRTLTKHGSAKRLEILTYDRRSFPPTKRQLNPGEWRQAYRLASYVEPLASRTPSGAR